MSTVAITRRGKIGAMMAMLAGAGFGSEVRPITNRMMIESPPMPRISPSFFGLGTRASYGRPTASGRTRIRRKNKLQVSRATKRKHRRAA